MPLTELLEGGPESGVSPVTVSCNRVKERADTLQPARTDVFALYLVSSRLLDAVRRPLQLQSCTGSLCIIVVDHVWKLINRKLQDYIIGACYSYFPKERKIELPSRARGTVQVERTRDGWFWVSRKAEAV